MQTVFSHIIQKRYSQSYEDVATDALAYILSTHEPVRQAMMAFLRKIEPDLPDLHFRTQISEGDIRPDMWGFSGANTHLFVENKFWAGLTANQPVAYLNELAKYSESTVLLMIVPGAREQIIIAELMHRLQDGGVAFTEENSDDKGIVWCVKTDIGSKFALTSWPRLIDILESASRDDLSAINDLKLLDSLCEAADIDKFIPVHGNDLNNQRTPALLLQFGQLIRDAIEIGLRDGFLSNEGLTESVNWTKFGKYLSLGQFYQVGIWFGLDYTLWKEFGASPLWVVFSTTNWGRAFEVEPLLRKWKDNQRIYFKLQNDYLVLPINITAGADKDQVLQNIVNQLRELASLLSELPLKSDTP